MKKFCLFLLIFVLFLPLNSFSWQKNVLISPLRVVMDKKTRSASVKIINPSDFETTYRIKLVSMDMDEKGKQTPSENINKDCLKAMKMIRFSPKKITLKPNGLQTIRLMARKPAGLPAGEYRCHLKVSPLPPDNPPEKEASKTTAIKIDLNFLVSTTIPVIIRNGNTFASVNIENAGLNNGTLSVSLNRLGNSSALFNLEVYSKDKLIGKRNRIAFYTPNKKLLIPVSLDFLPQKNEKIVIKAVNEEPGEKFLYDVFSTEI